VLENYHVAEAFKLIKSHEKYNIFSELRKEQYKIMRKRIVECVLATDMSFHAKQFTYLKLKIDNHSIKDGENTDELVKNLDNFSLYNLQQEFLNVFIHAADISNPTKPFNIYKKWVDMVIGEFWLQGDREKQIGLPPSFLCDRNTVTKHDSQLGFMDGISIPFYTAVCQIFPELYFLIENIGINKTEYKKIKEEYEKDKEKKN
jgi:hypothetical protein